MLPSSSDLTYFVEVANTLNVSRAAERLGISQPSLTLAVQRLEGVVGTDLLIRNKRGVILTQAGKQLLVHSRRLLESWEQVKTEALASVNEIQGSYMIGCHPSVALYSLPRFLPDLLEQHPKLEVKLRHDLSRKIAEGVISSTIDLGIVVNPVKHPDLVLHKICEDEVTLWTGPGRREIQDIRSGRAVLICDPELAQSQWLLKQLRKSDIPISKVLASSSLEVITELVASGCGIGLLPSRVAQFSKTSKLKRVPKAPFYVDEICLMFRMENKGVKSIQMISQAIRDCFKESSPEK